MFGRFAVAVVVLALTAGCSKKAEVGAGEERPDEERPNDEKPVDLTGKTIDEVQQLCHAKDGAACYEAGRRHAEGVGVSKDPVTAWEWFARGCELSWVEACWEVGRRAATTEERSAALEKACDLGHYKSCSSVGRFKTGGITWTLDPEVKGKLIMQLANVSCSVERSGHGECQVSGYFYDGWSGSRSLAAKFYDAGGALLGNDLLFYEPVGPQQVVKKTIRTVPGVTSAVIGFWH